MNKSHRLLVLTAVVLAGCQSAQPPSPFQVANDQLSLGRPDAAVQTLATVPWSAPDVEAARVFVSQIVTRIDLVNSGTGNQRPRVDIVEATSVLPHDASCFTEGLAFDDGALIESCGGYGHSTVRRVDIATGTVLSERPLNEQYFGEGVTPFEGKVFVLTWLDETELIFDSSLSHQDQQLPLKGEGWGLTHDASHLIYSNGSNQIRFVDPKTGVVTKVISVFNGDVPLMNINELEYVNGEIFANIWLTDRIARIDPESGKLLGWILAEGLLPNSLRNKAEVLNGIAYDPNGERLFLTGKWWPFLFVVRLKPFIQ